MRVPYTYIIESDEHLYVGSKYGADAHPSGLLTRYFTSSKYARPLILKDPTKWRIVRLQEGSSTEEVVAREMEWQLEFRHHRGLLNKCINRAEGKWVNYGPKSDETRSKLSASRKGKRNSPEVAKLIGEKIRGRAHTPEAVERMKASVQERWDQTSELRRKEIGATIRHSMKTNGTSVGAKNSNTTRWALESPTGQIFEQPEILAGKEFIQSLGLSYQMLIKFRSKNLPFTGKLSGWKVLSCSRDQSKTEV